MTKSAPHKPQNKTTETPSAKRVVVGGAVLSASTQPKSAKSDKSAKQHKKRKAET